MKDFKTYLAEARQMISEDVQIQEELLAFFEENNIQYNDHLLDFARDLVLQTEGIDLKEKLSKAKDFIMKMKDKGKDFVSGLWKLTKNPKVQAIAFIALALYLISQGHNDAAITALKKCSTTCDIKTITPELLVRQAAAVIDTFKDTLGENQIEAFKELAFGGKTILKNAIDLIASKDFSGIKNLGAALSLGTAAKKAMTKEEEKT